MNLMFDADDIFMVGLPYNDIFHCFFLQKPSQKMKEKRGRSEVTK